MRKLKSVTMFNYMEFELFNLHKPTSKPIPLIANLPHSGTYVPREIAAKLTQEHKEFLPNSDWHLDKLYDFLPSLGITVLQANYSRYVVDLNRELKEPTSGNFWTSVVPLQTAFGAPIYTTNPTYEEVQQRLVNFYTRYHKNLQVLIQEKIAEFGQVYFLDLHSFGGIIDDQICLGNASGKTCGDFLISTVEKSFIDVGYQVVRNKVFTGGYITRNYGSMTDVEALQIEVRYHVYLDENQIDKPQIPNWNSAKFSNAKSKFKEVFINIINQLGI